MCETIASAQFSHIIITTTTTTTTTTIIITIIIIIIICMYVDRCRNPRRQECDSKRSRQDFEI
jgi:hypothetical protein